MSLEGRGVGVSCGRILAEGPGRVLVLAGRFLVVADVGETVQGDPRFHLVP